MPRQVPTPPTPECNTLVATVCRAALFHRYLPFKLIEKVQQDGHVHAGGCSGCRKDNEVFTVRREVERRSVPRVLNGGGRPFPRLLDDEGIAASGVLGNHDAAVARGKIEQLPAV